MYRPIHIGLALAVALAAPSGAAALTVSQFTGICASAAAPWAEHPLIRAYVGGALDLLATLDEQTAYLDDLYCTAPSELFDVPAIIRFMESHRDSYETRNAMLLLVRYVEANGGCEAGG